MTRIVHAVIALTLVTACARPIPSLVPLGEGPLSRAHAPETERVKSSATAKLPHAGSTKEASEGTKDRDPTDTEGKGEEESSATKQAVDAESKKQKDKDKEKDKEKAPEKSGKSETATWDGEYAGEDVSTYRFEGAPDRVQRDANAKTRVKREDNVVHLTIVDSSNGKDLCTFNGKVEKMTATIDAGQECFASEEGIVRTRGVVKSGTARIDGDKLVIEAELDFEFRAADRLREGRLSYRFEGKRK